jgi:ATP-binding cassette, subfamily B, bacterial
MNKTSIISSILAELPHMKALLARYWPYTQSTRKQILLALALTILLPMLATAMFSLLRQLIDNIFAHESRAVLPWLIGAVLVVGFTRLLIEYADQCLDGRIAEQIALEVRAALYERLISASPELVQKRGVGALLAHLDQDASRISALVYGVPVGVFAHIAKAVCFVIFLLTLSWQLTLMAVLVMPLLGWMVLRMTPLVRRASSIARHRSSAWMSRAEERLGALTLINVYEAHEFENAHFRGLTRSARHAEVRAITLEARLSLAINVITGVGSAAVLIAGFYQVQAQLMTPGSVIAFLAALGSLYDPLRGVTQGAGRWQRAAASAVRVAQLMDEHRSGPVETVQHSPGSVVGAIEFQNVSFSYANGIRALHNISLSIGTGERIALVGASGSGKSSLLRLLTRLHDAQVGIISIDAIDIKQIPRVKLHGAMAVALQDAYLFSGTIAENIRYNQTELKPEQVIRAARMACVDSFAETLGRSYASPVGSRGERLSGGQRQRVALARALLRNAPILLLDEATSALDSETEENIHKAIAKSARHSTVIMASHRLSSVRAADRIIVLEQGRIVESGTPQQLLKPNTRCYALFAAQIAAEYSGAKPHPALFTDRDKILCARV